MAKDSAELSALLMNRSLAEEIRASAVKVPALRRFFSQSSEPKSTRRMKSTPCISDQNCGTAVRLLGSISSRSLAIQEVAVGAAARYRNCASSSTHGRETRATEIWEVLGVPANESGVIEFGFDVHLTAGSSSDGAICKVKSGLLHFDR